MRAFFVVMTILFAVFVCVPIYQGLTSFCFNAFDLGIYSRALAALSQGDLNPWISVRGVKIFFDHFDPILIPAAYALPRAAPALWMIVGEWIAVVIAAWAFVTAYRRNVFTFAWSAFGVAVVFFGDGILRAVHYPGHPSSWSLAALSWSCYFFRAEKIIPAVLLLGACCFFKEEYAIYCALVGSFLFWKNENKMAKRTGLLLALFGVVWCFGVFVLRPLLAAEYIGYERVLAGGSIFEKWRNFYGDLDHIFSIAAIFAFALPIFSFTSMRKHYALALLLLSMVFVRFMGMWWFPHRSAQVVIVALWTLLPAASLRKWRLYAACALVALCAAPYLKFARTLVGHPYKKSCPANSARLVSLRKGTQYLLEHAQSPAAVQGHFVPHLSLRDHVHLLRHVDESMTYILLETSGFGDPWPNDEQAMQKLAGDLRKNASWHVIIDDGQILLVERRAR